MLDYQYTNLLNHDKSHLHVNNCKVIFNIIKAVFGIGLLSISYTIKLSGWLFLLPLCVISLITCYNAYNSSCITIITWNYNSETFNCGLTDVNSFSDNHFEGHYLK